MSERQRFNRREFLRLSAVAMGASVLAACAPAATPTMAPSAPGTTPAATTAAPVITGEKVVRIRTTASVGTHFNPMWFIGTGSQWHTFPFIWYPLVFYNSQGLMDPWLAETIETSEDAKVWTFHLHQNAMWTDGQPVTAEDVKWSWEMLMNPKTAEIGAVGSYVRDYIVGAKALLNGETETIEGIEVVDDHTVRFTLEVSNPLFLSDAYVFVMPKHVLAEIPLLEWPNHPYMDNPTVTSGPYVLAKYEPRNFIELEARADWWGAKKPNIDRVVLVQPANAETALNMLEAGELDMSPYLAVSDVERIEGMAGMRAVVQLLPGISNLVVNGRKEYLQDKRVRQAFSYLIDRDQLNEIEYLGYGVPIYSDVIGPEWAISPNLNTYPHDPEKAKQLLEEAGWDFSRTLVYWSNSAPEDLDVRALYLQDAFKQIGIEMEIRSSQYSAVADAHNEGFYDLTSLGGGNNALDPQFALEYYTCGGTWSTWLGYCNQRLEELRIAGMATSDINERQQIYWEASELLNDELPFVYLLQPPTVYAISDRLLNFEPPNLFRYANTTMMDWDVAS